MQNLPPRTPETVSTPELPTAIPTVAALDLAPTPTPFLTVPTITPDLPTFALAFEPISDIDTAREEHSATRLDDGRVLIVGGRNQFGTVLTVTLLFDPETNSLSAGGELNGPHSGHSATLLKDGPILVAGGSDDAKPLKSAEIYDPSTETLTTVGEISVA